ncbi:hypothetical protein [Amycolatopsis sp. MJM2582]|uniref:hypothetical protein n=1 Tax=Amycolatopsis sp. MJM2582 TaxID=1427749 RepID=UPI000AC6B4B8|nr:hypothetical protein [Amycolatopsis sp. MJM2582]
MRENGLLVEHGPVPNLGDEELGAQPVVLSEVVDGFRDTVPMTDLPCHNAFGEEEFPGTAVLAVPNTLDDSES